jgi:hypothetical protein
VFWDVRLVSVLYNRIEEETSEILLWAMAMAFDNLLVHYVFCIIAYMKRIDFEIIFLTRVF